MGTRADPPCFDNVNRYVDCGNGTVTDTLTEMIWLKNASCFGPRPYAAANQAAAALADGQCGLTDGSTVGDWRLPTNTEWEATVTRLGGLLCSPSLTNDAGAGCLGAGPTSFVGVQPSLYWSSSTRQGVSPLAWVTNLFDAGLGSGPKDAPWRVWPVRGGR